MPRASLINRYFSSDSDDSDSDDEVQDSLELARYQQLQLSQALQNSRTRIRALQELTQLLSACYAKATKAAQAALLADVLDACKISDRRAAWKQLMAELVRAADKVLPQQKRHMVQSQYKRQALAMKRGDRRHGDDGNGDDDDDDVQVLYDLPLPDAITCAIMEQLDPVALAHAACVCRAWRDIVHSDYGSHLWAAWAQRLYPPHGRRRLLPASSGSATTTTCAHTGSAAARFASLVQGNPQPILAFKSCRAFVGNAPVWLHHDVQVHPMTTMTTIPSTAACGATSAARQCTEQDGAGRQRRRHTRSNMLYPDVQQVVQWALGRQLNTMMRTAAAGQSSSSGNSSSCCSDTEDAAAAGARGAMNQLRLWAVANA